MNYIIYSLKNDSNLRTTIAYEVDIYFWKKRGIATNYIASTKSLHYVLRHEKSPMNTPLVYSSVNMLCDSGWNCIEEQARLTYPQLRGRALLWSELGSLLYSRKIEYTEIDLAKIIQYLYLQGYVTFSPGVTLGKTVSAWSCSRCFAPYPFIHKIECATCGGECAYCEKCLLLGRSRSCDLFLQFHHDEEKQSISLLPPKISLTLAQERISESVKAFLNSTKTHALVWAVTGAGKTEMLVPIVENVLSKGGKVLWVTPRKDVVIELAPRLRTFFPEVTIVSLYGGSEDAWGDGALIVATAHQACRFYRGFDLIIVDEVDAFPLYRDQALNDGINRACALGGKQVYLTATPSARWKKEMSASSTLFVLPVRYHGYPLPLPVLATEWFLKHKLERHLAIPAVSQFLQKVVDCQGQAFIFVPRTQDVQKVVAWLIQSGVNKSRVTGVFSQDARRKEKVQQFRQGRISILVTTTILERGVTVPRCFVLVWGADHPIFDRASLVQIAGRVGRSLHYQHGEVWFLSSARTESQRGAKKELEWLNEQAEKEGFLKKGAYIP